MRIDTTNFMKAQAVWRRHSRTEPAKNLNRAVYFVIRRAQQLTPRVMPGVMDSELGVLTQPKIKRNGQLSHDKKGRGSKINVLGHITSGGGYAAPLAALIINARVLRADISRSQPGMSKYNRITGMRYARLYSPFKGVSRRTGAAKMTAAITRMVRYRHSSSGFFRASWGAVMDAMLPGLPGFKSPKMDKPSPPGIGAASPAIPGSTHVQCVIENRLGMEGNPILASARNRAAHRILGPALQQAIDLEFSESIRKFDAKGWLADAPELANYGFVLTV